jgi:hypothetical protein
MLAIHRRRRKGELGVFIPRSSCVRPGASTHAADPRWTGRVHEAKSFDGSPDVSAARQTRAALMPRRVAPGAPLRFPRRDLNPRPLGYEPQGTADSLNVYGLCQPTLPAFPSVYGVATGGCIAPPAPFLIHVAQPVELAARGRLSDLACPV